MTGSAKLAAAVPSETESVRTEPSPRLAEPVAAVLEAALQKEEELPVEEKRSDSLEAVVTSSVETDEAPKELAADEVSIPPAGDLAVDEQFFSEGDLAHHLQGDAHAHHDHDEWDDVKPASQKHLPHVVERRERFAKYVKWAVAGAAVLCLAAVGRTAVAPSHAVETAKASSVAAVEAPAPVVEKKAEPVKAAEPTPAPVAPAAKAEEPAKVEEPAKAAEPAAPAAKAEEPAKAADPAPAADVDAKAEKVTSRKALEGGKLDAAIAAGERSVGADPSDGEAWLILGAAYQEKGKLADARRCYTACVKQGKRGPIGECSAMLR